MAQFTREQVLDYLDNSVYYPGTLFMDLENGYCYTANSRLSLVADGKDRAIVFEKSGCPNRRLAIELELDYFGSSLRNLEAGGSESVPLL